VWHGGALCVKFAEAPDMATWCFFPAIDHGLVADTPPLAATERLVDPAPPAPFPPAWPSLPAQTKKLRSGPVADPWYHGLHVYDRPYHHGPAQRKVVADALEAVKE